MVLTFYLIGVLFIRRDTVTPKNNPTFFDRELVIQQRDYRTLYGNFRTFKFRRYKKEGNTTTPFNMIGYC